MYNGTQVKNRLTTCITALLGSRRFWYGVLAFFVFESVWIAFSARYPMAFDEDFHLGVIKIYSQHWLPFLSAQPDNANQFGALQSDPSYLYHYLMSFPYRFVAAITDNQTAQVIVLRLLNIPLVAGALVLFRRVLLRTGVSAAYAHTAISVFVLIPILPLLSGQINYDNLLLLLLAWMCLLAFDAYVALRERSVDYKTLVTLLVVCMLTSLVKYAFLPMAIVSVVFVAIGAVQGFYGCRWRAVWGALVDGYRQLSKRAVVILVIVFVLAFGLFVQRYGVNVVQYHKPVPACDDVLDDGACSAYGPWLRNYQMAEAKGNAPLSMSPLQYTWRWFEALHYRLFFVVNGPYDSYRNYPPLPVPAALAVLLVVSGLVALVLCARRVFVGQPFMIYIGVLTLFYMLVLWAEDYSQFTETGQPVAINGRYLLPVLLLIAAVFGRALHIVLSRTPRVKPVAAALVILLMLQGGGVVSFISRSDATWYWQNTVVWRVNNTAQRVIAPFIIPGSKYF
jgi:hypothetical protein